MLKSFIDILVGLLIVVAAAIIAFNWYNQTKSPRNSDHYNVYALFTDMTGLEVGSDVKISGIPVGYVAGYTLDPNSYMAKVTVSIRNGVNVPKDSMASVSGEGFFGRKYLKISPGSQLEYYKSGDSLELTQPPVNLEDMLSGLLFKSGS